VSICRKNAITPVFRVGGALVEFWWPGLAVCLMGWAYCRRPSWLRLALWMGALASLYVINRNLWALAALLLIFAAGQVKINGPRGRLASTSTTRRTWRCFGAWRDWCR
jgi:hypothetical protein